MTNIGGRTLFEARDPSGDALILRSAVDGPGVPDTILAVLTIAREPSPSAGAYSWKVERESARSLRDALNRLLVEDGGSAENAYLQATLEGAQALHAMQHRQMAAAARRIADHVDDHAAALARFAADRDAVRAAPPLLGMLLDVQRRSVADLGDLLAAIAGQP